MLGFLDDKDYVPNVSLKGPAVMFGHLATIHLIFFDKIRIIYDLLVPEGKVLLLFSIFSQDIGMGYQNSDHVSKTHVH